VDGVRAAARGVLAKVTLTSDAIRHRLLDPGAATRTDQLPFNEGGPTGRTNGEFTQTTPARSAFARRRNVLHVEASDTAALTTDLRGARLRVGRRLPLVVELSSGHSLRLTLAGVPRARLRIALDGHRSRLVAARRRRLALVVPAGHHRAVVTLAG
jgi:hypothetical protein